MAKHILENVFMAIGGYDLSSDTNRLDLPLMVEAKEATVFTSQGWKEVLPGKKSAQWQFSGFNETGLDEVAFAALGASAAPVVAVPNNPPVPGDIAYFMQAIATSYKDGQTEGEIRSYELTVQGAHKTFRGYVIDYLTATTTGNGASVTLPAVASDQHLYVAALVLSASVSDTLDLEIESDGDNTYGSALTRFVLDQFSATGWQFDSLAGPITDTEYRVARTVGGSSPSFRYIVVLAVA